MNKNQENNLSMFDELEKFLDENTPIWEGFAGIKNGVIEFKTKLSELRTVVGKHGMDITGAASDKDREEDELINALSFIIKGLRSFAFYTKNETLRKSIDITPASLKKLRDTELAQKANEIKNIGLEYETALLDYAVTIEMHKNLSIELNDFKKALSQPRDMIVNRKNLTIEIAILFDEIKDILETMLDSMMYMFKDSNPGFYIKYNEAREVIDLGVRHENPVEEN